MHSRVEERGPWPPIYMYFGLRVELVTKIPKSTPGLGYSHDVEVPSDVFDISAFLDVWAPCSISLHECPASLQCSDCNETFATVCW